MWIAGPLALTVLFFHSRGPSEPDYGSPAFRAAILKRHAPTGPEWDLVQKHCMACHTATRIAKAGGTQAGWADRMRRMIRFGSTMPREDIPAVATYLAKLYPPRPAPDAVVVAEPVRPASRLRHHREGGAARL